eukprot:13283478-Alexandrium_andersonii.AAC.1
MGAVLWATVLSHSNSGCREAQRCPVNSFSPMARHPLGGGPERALKGLWRKSWPPCAGHGGHGQTA